MAENEKEPIRQFLPEDHEEKNGKVYFEKLVCERPFWFKTCDGPSTSAPVGAIIEVWDRWFISALFFTRKAAPLNVPEVAEYVCKVSFRVAMDGKWQQVPQGAIVRLTRAEAIEMMRQSKVKPIDEGVFYIT